MGLSVAARMQAVWRHHVQVATRMDRFGPHTSNLRSVLRLQNPNIFKEKTMSLLSTSVLFAVKT